MTTSPHGSPATHSWNDLVQRVLEYYPSADREWLRRLSDVATQHLSKIPADRPCNLAHSCSTAAILVELRLDTTSIAAGLLAGGVAGGIIPLTVIKHQLGGEVVEIINGVVKIAQLSARAGNELQPEEFRRMILASAKDIRVVLVQLAISLQRLRDMGGTEAERVRLATVVQEIYAPIAHRLGIHWIKSELDDLAFQIINPDEYHELQRQVAERRKGGTDVVRKVIELLEEQLKRDNIKGRVSGREKHLYSIWEKLRRKGTVLDDLYDLVAYRIIVRKKNDCYRVLGMIHSNHIPIPGQFNDYIAIPKSNGYQSLHTAVIGPFGNRIEIQIRTERMHQIAESGVAAHWVYKNNGGLEVGEQSAAGFTWLKELLEEHRKAEDPSQFLENVKIDLFPNEVYLFTPAGKIITLPRGATAVDFAYAVHSEIGDHCQGAKVNGRMTPLKNPLETGDRVEIITSKNQHPNSNWLQFVVTGKAKYRISRWVRQQQREQNILIGRELLEREVRKSGQGLLLNDKALARGVAATGLESVDELLYRVGIANLSPISVLHKIFPEAVTDPRSSLKPKPAPAITVEKSRAGEGLSLSGSLAGMVVNAARCCNPVPGDGVVGLIASGKGIILHRNSCTNLNHIRSEHPERILGDILWPDTSAEAPYITHLLVTVTNRMGVLTHLSQAINDHRGNLLEAHLEDRESDPCTMVLNVEVSGTGQLERIIDRLRALPVVTQVDRARK